MKFRLIYLAGYAYPKETLVFTCLHYKSFENTVGKGEIACDEEFLLCCTVFSTDFGIVLPFSSSLKLSSANFFSLEESKICHLGNG